MPNCVICGKPAVSALVFHSECWERMVIGKARKVCDYACKWAVICDDPERLKDVHCDNCALMEIVESSLCRVLEL